MKTKKFSNYLIIILSGVLVIIVAYIISIGVQFFNSRNQNKVDLADGYYLTYPENWLVTKEDSTVILSKDQTKISVAVVQLAQSKSLNDVVLERLDKLNKIKYQIDDVTLGKIPFKKITINDDGTQQEVFKLDKLIVYAGLIDEKYYVTFSVSYVLDGSLEEAINLLSSIKK